MPSQLVEVPIDKLDHQFSSRLLFITQLIKSVQLVTLSLLDRHKHGIVHCLRVVCVVNVHHLVRAVFDCEYEEGNHRKAEQLNANDNENIVLFSF